MLYHHIPSLPGSLQLRQKELASVRGCTHLTGWDSVCEINCFYWVFQYLQALATPSSRVVTSTFLGARASALAL